MKPASDQPRRRRDHHAPISTPRTSSSSSSSSSFSLPTTMLTTATTLLAITTAIHPANAMLDCSRIRTDGQGFNFKSLGGPHSVTTWQDRPPFSFNTTYTIDLCQALQRPKGVGAGEFCKSGTRVCAIGREIDNDTNRISEIIPIAGELKEWGMGDLDPTLTRLKTSESSADAKKEGVRIVLNGGKYGGVKQKAIIEMLCNRQRTGLEGEWVPGEGDKKDSGKDEKSSVEEGEQRKTLADSDEDEKTEHQFLKENATLIFDGYDTLGDDQKTRVLRLSWHTKYACESATDEDVPDQDNSGGASSSWGFFTWLFLIVFLATASYLIFGSWLNYSRHGARGWDLLPHGDTLRDVPYLLKDWIRSVLNTVQGSGSRGGYSTV